MVNIAPPRYNCERPPAQDTAGDTALVPRLCLGTPCEEGSAFRPDAPGRRHAIRGWPAKTSPVNRLPCPLVEVQSHVVSAAAASDNVGPAVAVDVVRDQVFGGHAAVIDHVLGPLTPRLV